MRVKSREEFIVLGADNEYVFVFGRYIGKQAREHLPYLIWMLEQDFPDSVKELAEEIIQSEKEEKQKRKYPQQRSRRYEGWE